MQLEIAWRGLQLLRAGGLMAYSTCSLNPIEDEAVVAALLQRAEAQAPGAVRLEAWPEREVLPGLLRRPGVSSWRVAEHVESDGGGGDAHGGAELRLCWHASYEDATAAGMAHALRTLWPPPAAAAASLGLERCSRLLHHDQDTGGFFIALLRKRRPLAPSDDGGTSAAAASQRPATGPASSRELPELEAEDVMVPLVARQARAIGAQLGLPPAVAERRLLSVGGAHPCVYLAPEALKAFGEGELCAAGAGVPIKDVRPANE